MKILKSKIFVMFLIVLVLLNIFLIDFSSAFSVNYDDKKWDYGDIQLSDYTFASPSFYNGSIYFMVLFSFDTEPIIKPYSTGVNRYDMFSVTNANGFCYYLYPDGRVQTVTYIDYDCPNLFSFDTFKENCVYLNFDVHDSSGNLLFQRPVLSLGEVLEITTPVETFRITMNGIILSLTVFLVGLVAFWKAWSFLSNSLRKA